MADPAASTGCDPSGEQPGEPETTASRPGARVDSRPPATHYVHLSQNSFTRDGSGVARFEGVGPLTADQARRFLSHCHVTIRPVIDLEQISPVDSYEIPDRIREAVHLHSPVDTFPFATNTSRRRDLDHTAAYQHPDDGGPPSQTRLDNLGPMTRFHHRIKTHSRWQVRQPFNGLFVWRSPHGRNFVVDPTGTHRIPKAARPAVARCPSSRRLVPDRPVEALAQMVRVPIVSGVLSDQADDHASQRHWFTVLQGGAGLIQGLRAAATIRRD